MFMTTGDAEYMQSHLVPMMNKHVLPCMMQWAAWSPLSAYQTIPTVSAQAKSMMRMDAPWTYQIQSVTLTLKSSVKEVR